MSWLDPHKSRKLTVVGSRKVRSSTTRPSTSWSCMTRASNAPWAGMARRSSRCGRANRPSSRLTGPNRCQREAQHFVDCIRAAETAHLRRRIGHGGGVGAGSGARVAGARRRNRVAAGLSAALALFSMMGAHEASHSGHRALSGIPQQGGLPLAGRRLLAQRLGRDVLHRIAELDLLAEARLSFRLSGAGRGQPPVPGPRSPGQFRLADALASDEPAAADPQSAQQALVFHATASCRCTAWKSRFLRPI